MISKKLKIFLTLGVFISVLGSIIFLAAIIQPEINDLSAEFWKFVGILILGLLAFICYLIKSLLKKVFKKKEKIESNIEVITDDESKSITDNNKKMLNVDSENNTDIKEEESINTINRVKNDKEIHSDVSEYTY